MNFAYLYQDYEIIIKDSSVLVSYNNIDENIEENTLKGLIKLFDLYSRLIVTNKLMNNILQISKKLKTLNKKVYIVWGFCRERIMGLVLWEKVMILF